MVRISSTVAVLLFLALFTFIVVLTLSAVESGSDDWSGLAAIANVVLVQGHEIGELVLDLFGICFFVGEGGAIFDGVRLVEVRV